MKRLILLVVAAASCWGQCTPVSGTQDARTWIGTYAGGTTYALCDVVYDATDGKAYVSIQAANTGHAPDSSTTWWTVLYAAPVNLQSTDPLKGSNLAMNYNLAWTQAHVSTATQTALDGKAASNASTTVNGQACALGSTCTVADGTKVPTSTTVNGHALSGNVSVTATDVGLGSANNTADTGKPVSTAQQTALDLKAPLASPTFTGTVGIATAASDPGTCGVGQVYQNTATTKLRRCIAVNTWADVITADATGSVAVGNTLSATNFDQYNAPYLRGLQAAVGAVAAGTGRLSICSIGHSWVAHSAPSLYNVLTNNFGVQGIGYVSLGNPGTLDAVKSVVQTLTGTWALHDGTSDSTVKSVDLYSISTSDIAATDTIPLITPMTDLYIHWWGQTGGGTFTYKLDAGGSPVAVDTSAALGYQTTHVTGIVAANSHSLIFGITSAGTAGVTLFGVDVRNGAVGATVYALGHNSSTLANWTAVDATSWQTGLAALGCNVVTVEFGINDAAGSISSNAFGASLATLTARIKAAVPLADVVYIADPDQGTVSTALIASYEAYEQSAAIANGYGFASISKPFGSYVVANSLGLYGGSNHPSAIGDALIGALLVKLLTVAPVSAMVKDSAVWTKTEATSPAWKVNGLSRDFSDATSAYGMAFYLLHNGAGNHQGVLCEDETGEGFNIYHSNWSGYNCNTFTTVDMTVGVTGKLTNIAGSAVLVTTSTPASNAACTAGQITWDASYVYICTASGAWKRAPLTGPY